VNAVMKLWVPHNAGNFLTSWRPVSFSRRTLLRGMEVSKDGDKNNNEEGNGIEIKTREIELHFSVCK